MLPRFFEGKIPMRNLERFNDALDWKPIDRLLTYDFLDNKSILEVHGGYDASRSYTFDELIEINGQAWKSIGVDVTRFVYDPASHWMGTKIENWVRFFDIHPDNWKVSQAGETAWISHRPFKTLSELEKNMLEELLDYLTRNKIELKGRTLASVTQLSNEWHLMNRIVKGTTFHSWLPLQGVKKWTAKEKNGPTWVVIELTTSKKLLAEGKSQKHCVGSYANVCGEYGHHIFTMNRHDELNGKEKCVTIEVGPDRRVVQVRGKLNRPADSTEVSVLRVWAAENNIRY